MPKRRGQPKGGWKKAKLDAELALKGNDEFKLTPAMEAEAKNFDFAAVTDEDMALDRMLAETAKAQPKIDDASPAIEVTKPRENLEHLKTFVEEYMPADSIAELTEQVHVAKSEGCDSIDGTNKLIKQIFRADYEKITTYIGYGIYHDIRVYAEGMFDKVKGVDKMTMEQKLHGGAKKS